MARLKRIVGGCAVILFGLISGCSLMASRSGCEGEDFVQFHACLQQKSAKELRLAPALRQAYLIYAEKLAQDISLEELSSAEAIKALSVRRQQLLQDPKQAEQCARFAERVLCY